VNIAVVGHVEWIEFVRVDHVPQRGEIVHAGETWCEAAGGGAVAAVQLARLAGSSTLFTAIGDDELGRKVVPELERHGVTVHAAVRAEPQRRGFTYVDSAGERTITVIGERLGPRRSDDLPWEELAEADGVYFVSGDAAALKAAREAKVLVATARSLATLAEGRVELDALVRSRNDEGETYRPGDLDPPPRTDVGTAGSQGGTFTPVGGALLGAFVFEPLRTMIRAKPELAWYDHVGLFLTDPIGGLNGTLERLFGIKSDVHVGIKPPLAAQGDRVVRQARFGLELSLDW